jgi:hypothetical protein
MSTLKTGKVKTTTIADELDTESTAVTNVINGSAKAWVNFNGTGTVAIRSGFNVSSITDVTTGTYEVNFTTAFSNTNYCVVGSVIGSSGGSSTYSSLDGRNVDKTVSTVRVGCANLNGTLYDQGGVNVVAYA